MDCSMPGFLVLHYLTVCSNSCPLSWRCRPTIASSVAPFSFCLQSFLASGSSSGSALRSSWLKYWSFIFSISPSNEYSGLISSRINWFDLLQSKELSRVFSSTTRAWLLIYKSGFKKISLVIQKLNNALLNFLTFFSNTFYYCPVSCIFILWVYHCYPETLLRGCFWIQFFSSVQWLNCVPLFATLWTTACQVALSITNSWSLLKLMSIELVRSSNHLILCHPLLLLPSIFPSIRVFSNESILQIQEPKNWSFSLSISPSNEYSGLISFRIDRFDLAVQRTLKSLLQHHSSKASILRCSAFFIVQLSHSYMTTGKIIALMDLCWQSNVSAF